MKHEQSIPRARKDGLIVEELPDEVLVYDLERHKAHCLSKTAASIWKRCNGRRTATDLAAGADVDERVVRYALKQLSDARLLSNDLPAGAAISRRDVVKAGFAAAIAVPLVASIVAPHAAQAATILSSACASGTVNQCCGGNRQLCRPQGGGVYACTGTAC